MAKAITGISAAFVLKERVCLDYKLDLTELMPVIERISNCKSRKSEENFSEENLATVVFYALHITVPKLALVCGRVGTDLGGIKATK